MVNITRGWIHVRDDRFSKLHNRKNLQSLESFGKWRHNYLARATCTAKNVYDPSSLAKRLTWHGMSFDCWYCENINNDAMEHEVITNLEI